MKRIFVIDWILIVVFIMSAISGFGLHVAGHGGTHEVWHNWAVFHVFVSMLFLIAVIFHVAMHLEWYKGIIKKGIGRKSKVTAVLSVIFFIAVGYRSRTMGYKWGKFSVGIMAL